MTNFSYNITFDFQKQGVGMQEVLNRFCAMIDSEDDLIKAQNYIHSDSSSCVVKIRKIAESFVDYIYKQCNISLNVDVYGGGGQ